MKNNFHSLLPILILSIFYSILPVISHSQNTLKLIEKTCDGNVEKGIDHIFALAKGGNSAATFLLAMMLAENDQTTLSSKYLKASAEQGNANGMKALGTLAFNDKNYPEAKYWFEAAAKLRNINALMYLGIMHRDGLGRQANNETAYFWFTVAEKLKKTSTTGDIEPEKFASDVSGQLSPTILTRLSLDSEKWIIEHPEIPPQSVPPC